MAAALTSTEWLNRIIALTRKYSDETLDFSKYSDAEMVVMIEHAFQTILADLSTTMDNPIRVRHSVVFGTSTQDYILPPSVGVIRRIYKVNATTGLAEWELIPRSEYNLSGPSFLLEGRNIRLQPKWTSSETVVIEYTPNGDFRLHYGTEPTATDGELDHLFLPATPTLGTLDKRENAYVGAVLRVWTTDGTFFPEERTIIAYDNTTRKATVSPDFSQDWFDHLAGNIVYTEVVPAYGRLLESVICWYLAQELAAISGDATKYAMAAGEYRRKMRALRIFLDSQEGIVGDSLNTDTPIAHQTSSGPYEVM
jgi:hypothetical protein